MKMNYSYDREKVLEIIEKMMGFTLSEEDYDKYSEELSRLIPFYGEVEDAILTSKKLLTPLEALTIGESNFKPIIL